MFNRLERRSWERFNLPTLAFKIDVSASVSTDPVTSYFVGSLRHDGDLLDIDPIRGTTNILDQPTSFSRDWSGFQELPWLATPVLPSGMFGGAISHYIDTEFTNGSVFYDFSILDVRDLSEVPVLDFPIQEFEYEYFSYDSYNVEWTEAQLATVTFPDFFWYIQEIPEESIFTVEADSVDFNNLTDGQLDTIVFLQETDQDAQQSLYAALDGDDEVFLPALENRTLINGTNYDISQTFDGSAGDDTLNGNNADDKINGGDDDDQIFGHRGNDTLEGGSGDDRIEGGTLGPDGTTDDLDTVILKGSRDQYTIEDSIGTRTSVFTHEDGERDILIDVELIDFDLGFDGPNVSDFNFLREMVDASLAVYPDQSGLFGDQSIWFPVHANQLAMPIVADESGDPRHQGQPDWTFSNGVFEALPTLSSEYAAVAHVGEATIDGQHTVIVAFRGTDTIDAISWLQDVLTGWGPQLRTLHWASLLPLIEGLERYLDEDPKIQLYFTGHSLGGALAQMALEHFSDWPDVRAATFGAPGAPTVLGSDPRIIHFEHTEDIIPIAGEASYLLPELAAQLLGLPFTPNTLSSLLSFEKPGERILIPLDSLIDEGDDGLGVLEHNKEWYRDTLNTLIEVGSELRFVTANTYQAGEILRVAADPRSTNSFGGDLGSPNSPYDELLFGLSGNDEIHARSGDDVIDGGLGNDTIIGGEGIDIKTGGSGSDVFKYTAKFHSQLGNVDTITDFERGFDKIDLGNFSDGFNPNQKFSFIGSASFTGAPMQLRVGSSVGANELQVEGDTDGDTTPDLVIRIQGSSELGHTDFLGIVRPPRNYVDLSVDNEDVILLDNLSEVLRGALEEHDGNTYQNFNLGDALLFESALFSQESLTVKRGSAILEIDIDLDGISDSTITLAGDYSNAVFQVQNVVEGTEIALYDGNSSPVGELLVVGQPVAGQVLSLDMSGVSDKDGIDTRTLQFQWYLDSVPLTGSVVGNLHLTQQHVGGEISATVTYTDNFGAKETVTSALTPTVSEAGRFYIGTPSNDEFIAGTGEDTVNAYAGDDTVFGGAGRDSIDGGPGADQINGGSERDTLIGGDGDDTLQGGTGDDGILAGEGDDRLSGGEGNDTLNGGPGTDTAVFSGNQAGYILAFSQSIISVIDKTAIRDGNDTLVDVEFLDFSTNTLGQPFILDQFTGTLSLSSEEFESFIELYIAYFNRAPDAVGLNFWGTAFANGTTLEQMARLFVDQDETRATYPSGTSNLEFATTVYNNVLGRTPDPLGINFWTVLLDNGAVERDEFILEVLRGAKAAPPTDASDEFVAQQLADQKYLATKVDIGGYYAVRKGMSDIENATAVMALFNGSAASVQEAVNAIDGYYEDALSPTGGEFIMLPFDDSFAVV